MNNYNIKHQIIKLNNNIDNDNYKKLYNLNIKSYPLNNKMVKKTDNGLIIKFYKYYNLSDLIDKNYNYFDDINKNYKYFEIFIILDYLNNKLDHPYFFNYVGITNIFYFYQLNRDITSIYNIGILMERYQTLTEYLDMNKTLDIKNCIKNLYNIVDLSIYIKNKYNVYHGDIKIDNILVKDDNYYLIDWGIVLHIDEVYFNSKRPPEGNTEMYPHYNSSSEHFFIYSIGILMIRILGWDYNVEYKDFTKPFILSIILAKIPIVKIGLFEDLIYDIFNKKIEKIEKLKNKLEYIYTLSENVN